MLCFGFVSGHGFSRAVKDLKRIGLQPLLSLHPAKKKPGGSSPVLFELFTARLKSCPDTKHQSGDGRKLAYSTDSGRSTNVSPSARTYLVAKWRTQTADTPYCGVATAAGLAA